MAVSVAIWSQDLEPNKRNVYTVENDIRISGASLAADLSDSTGRTVVELVIKIPDEYEIDDDEETGERPPMHKFVLCALTAGRVCPLVVSLMMIADTLHRLSNNPSISFCPKERKLSL
jgi:hypothetical protein